MAKIKNKAQLQQISDVAWLVRQGPRKLGILNKDVQDKFMYINGKDFITLRTENDVANHFGNSKIFEEQITDSAIRNDAFYIKGHLIDYETPYPLDPSHPDYDEVVPLYTKTPESDVYYAAGWYCVNFEKGWKHGHGPKYSTLTTYGYEGPFKTEIECRTRLKQLNKAKRIDERS